MRKKISVGLICCIVLAALAFVIISAMGHKTDRPGPEQQAQAALTKLLSCTLQQADELDAALSPEVPPDAGPGIQEAGSGLEEYLAAQFGDSMTEECINMLTANRTYYRSASFARQFNSDIVVDKLDVTKRSDGQSLYGVSAELKASSDDAAVATAFGTITMEKTETGWKASKIVLTVKAL